MASFLLLMVDEAVFNVPFCHETFIYVKWLEDICDLADS